MQSAYREMINLCYIHDAHRKLIDIFKYITNTGVGVGKRQTNDFRTGENILQWQTCKVQSVYCIRRKDWQLSWCQHINISMGRKCQILEQHLCYYSEERRSYTIQTEKTLRKKNHTPFSFKSGQPSKQAPRLNSGCFQTRTRYFPCVLVF